MSDLFADIEKSIISGNAKLPHLTTGEYALRIEDVSYLKTKRAGEAFIVEYTVLETSNPEAHPVGCRRSWYQPMQDEVVANGQVAKFVWAIYGYDPKRDKARAEAELTPVIRKRSNEACTPNAEGKKLFNGTAVVRASVFKKAPNDKELTLAKAESREPRWFENIAFSPYSKDPPPAPGQMR